MIGQVSGTAVVDERVFCIIGVRLHNRTIVFEARAHGPIPAGSATGYTLHDEDGAVVTRAIGIPGLEWPAIDEHDTLVLVLPLATSGHEAKAAGASLVAWPLMAAPPASS